MKLAMVGGLILLVVLTMSLAQIRYAIFNPVDSFGVLLGLTAEICFIIVVGYRFLVGKNPEFPALGTSYSLVGAKGGKSTKRKSNLYHNRKHKRTSF